MSMTTMLRVRNSNILIVTILLLIGYARAYAQIPEWPPDGTVPAEGNFVLPEGRYLPSTLDYNLVWSDQIIPYQVSDGQIEFAAKNYIGTQKLWANQMDLFRQHNDNFLAVIYHLAAGINPLHNDDCPDPKGNTGDGCIGVVAPEGYVCEWDTHFLPWLTEGGIATGSEQFESMFQHWSQKDAEHRVWHNDPYWLMNLENEDWQRYVGDICIDWIEGNQNEGCFFDVSVETNCYLYHPKPNDPAPNNFEWFLETYGYEINDRHAFADHQNRLFTEYYQYLYTRFHTATRDLLIIPNCDQMVTTVYDPVWMDGDDGGKTIDGAMMENFGAYTGYDMWLSIERGLRHLTGRGKILIAQFHADDPAERYRRAGMYMLIKNEKSYINMLISGSNVSWFPEYEIQIGRPLSMPTDLEGLRVSGQSWQSLWARHYSEGLVLCNTSGAAIEYDLSGLEKKYKIISTSGGGAVDENGIPPVCNIEYSEEVSTVSVPASDCLILIAEEDIMVHEQNLKPELIIYPQPATDQINVILPEDIHDNLTISIVDLLGRTIYNSSAQAAIEKIDTRNIDHGIYLLTVSNGRDQYSQQITICK